MTLYTAYQNGSGLAPDEVDDTLLAICAAVPVIGPLCGGRIAKYYWLREQA